MHNPTVLATLTAVLAVLPSAHGFYTKNSPVLQVNAANYERLIAKSNYTSIVEFYAPWCGHCQNLKPAYEQVAKKLDGIAKVAAIDCDDEMNKQFCGMQGVKGFPTLKIVRPGKKYGRPVVEDYQGERTAAAISNALASKVNNHVTRVTASELDGFLEGEKPKAIFFSSKGTTTPLLRSIAIDFLDVISVAQIRDKETAAVKKFGIEKFPSLILISGKDAEPIHYDGALEKKAIVKFLSQAGEPNPDPAPLKKNGKSKAEEKTKSSKAKKSEKSSKAEKKEKPTKAEKKEKASKASKAAEEKEREDVQSQASSSSSTTETTAPTAIPSIVPLASLKTQEELNKQCLDRKSHTCLLVFHPSEETLTREKASSTLSHINTKYVHSGRHLFPFYSISTDSEAGTSLPKALELDGEVTLVAVNARRGWWRQYQGDFGLHSVESWIDAIRMGEGSKNKLPKGVVVDTAEKVEESSSSTEAVESETAEAEPETVEEEKDDEEEIVHEDL
ncbi:PDI protein A prpA [Thelonectria olida]|uniref:protein disulfide-isomerase n=1 Tax=Thelonectria olida TaxID=1576542 RepID=A0A9P8W1N5_9HYPO|nr:PDI protein A prpA [Thelonectria olida]